MPRAGLVLRRATSRLLASRFTFPSDTKPDQSKSAQRPQQACGSGATEPPLPPPELSVTRPVDVVPA